MIQMQSRSVDEFLWRDQHLLNINNLPLASHSEPQLKEWLRNFHDAVKIYEEYHDQNKQRADDKFSDNNSPSDFVGLGKDAALPDSSDDGASWVDIVSTADDAVLSSNSI